MTGTGNLALDFTLEIRQHITLPTPVARCLRIDTVGRICPSSAGDADTDDLGGIDNTQGCLIVDILPEPESVADAESSRTYRTRMGAAFRPHNDE